MSLLTNSWNDNNTLSNKIQDRNNLIVKINSTLLDSISKQHIISNGFYYETDYTPIVNNDLDGTGNCDNYAFYDLEFNNFDLNWLATLETKIIITPTVTSAPLNQIINLERDFENITKQHQVISMVDNDPTHIVISIGLYFLTSSNLGDTPIEVVPLNSKLIFSLFSTGGF